MQKTWNIYIDDFMLEKVISQWIGIKMTRTYHWVFKVLLANNYVVPSDLSTYTSKNFKRFLWESLLERNWWSETYNNYRKCYRCYCEFLKLEWFIDENPIDLIKKRRVPQKQPRSLSKSELSQLLRILPNAFDQATFYGIRNITIVYTFLYTWLRLSELLNLKLSHLQVHDGYIKVIKWKWSKDRTVPLSKDIVRMLVKYLKERRKNFRSDDDLPVFPSVGGNILTERALRNIIEKLRKCITFHFTWHQLRHTYATELVRNNFDIYNISRILWHSKIDTTKIYLSVDTYRLKQQLDKVPMFA